MNAMKWIIRKSIYMIGNLLRWINIQFLRLTGVKIGKNCMISLRAKIDVRRGQVIIGNNSTITYGCVILSHDHAVNQLNISNDKGEGKTVIGDNVFIGVKSIILRNVVIGNNSIIGAGSVVTKDIPPGVIALGNPAKIIRKVNSSNYHDSDAEM